MDLDIPVKTAFMGIAALNIDRYTMNSFLDVPLEMNEGNGTSTIVKPWDEDRLQAFKQKYNVDNISGIIIDEISMVKAWMLAYLDGRLNEAKQNYSTPFGGVAALMLGEFDQQPTTAGSCLPHLVV